MLLTAFFTPGFQIFGHPLSSTVSTYHVKIGTTFCSTAKHWARWINNKKEEKEKKKKKKEEKKRGGGRERNSSQSRDIFF